MSNPGYGYQGYNQNPYQTDPTDAARQKLIASLMQPNPQVTGPWGGLANAGSSIAGAMALKGMQQQQQQTNANQAGAALPSVPLNINGIPTSISGASPSLPAPQSAVSSYLSSIFGGSP